MKDIIKDLENIKTKIHKHKLAIAKERDKLREVEGELTDLIDSLNVGVYSLLESTESLTEALDYLSEQL